MGSKASKSKNSQKTFIDQEIDVLLANIVIHSDRNNCMT